MSKLSKYVCGPTGLAPMNFDGETHINIYSAGMTEIGRMASNFYDSYTTTPLGKFRTLEGLYHVLRIAEYLVSTGKVADYSWNELRVICPELHTLLTCDGPTAIKLGRELKRAVYGGTSYRPGAFSKEAELVFVKALVQKLYDLTLNGRKLGVKLSERLYGETQLTHYYVYGGKAVWPPHYEWLPELIAGVVQHIDPMGDTFDVDAVVAAWSSEG